jgi:hypothetical protein
VKPRDPSGKTACVQNMDWRSSRAVDLKKTELSPVPSGTPEPVTIEEIEETAEQIDARLGPIGGVRYDR